MKTKQKRGKYGTVRVKIWSTQKKKQLNTAFHIDDSFTNNLHFFPLRSVGTFYLFILKILQQYESLIINWYSVIDDLNIKKYQ